MVVPVGGGYVVGGLIMDSGNSYENNLYSLRAKMLEVQEVQTRSAYKTVVRNFGNVDLEMFAERDVDVVTPNTGEAYRLRAGTPMFVETMRNDVVDFVGLVSASAGTSITLEAGAAAARLYVGAVLEINGEQRTITNIAGDVVTVNSAYRTDPPTGSIAMRRGQDMVNPHLLAVHRITDKYGSNIIDDNRYQVERATGMVRYLPIAGTAPTDASGAAIQNTIWHPSNQTPLAGQSAEPYYFGRSTNITVLPPPAGEDPGTAVPYELLGEVDDPVASGSNGPINDPTGMNGTIPATTNFALPAPNGEYSNIRIEAPPGVAFEVELNGAKLALSSSGGVIIIPFFDPNFTNDSIKANQSIDPDIYIQRFLKLGENVLTIKATQGDGSNGNGIRVDGMFNGVNLSTAGSSTSVNPRDWSTSRHSILGIAGKIDFQLGDRIALEDISDSVQKAQGVLESLTTLLAGTDLNALQSLLSVIR